MTSRALKFSRTCMIGGVNVGKNQCRAEQVSTCSGLEAPVMTVDTLGFLAH